MGYIALTIGRMDSSVSLGRKRRIFRKLAEKLGIVKLALIFCAKVQSPVRTDLQFNSQSRLKIVGPALFEFKFITTMPYWWVSLSPQHT
jgi:hypothetical protein